MIPLFLAISLLIVGIIIILRSDEGMVVQCVSRHGNYDYALKGTGIYIIVSGDYEVGKFYKVNIRRF